MIENTITQAIKGFMRSITVATVLSFKVISEVLDVYYVNWMSKDDKFYSLLVIANETQVFSKTIPLLGIVTDEKMFFDVFYKNLRVFDTKIDWSLGKWSLDYAITISQSITKELQEYKAPACLNPVYNLVSFCVYTRPRLAINVVYSKNGVICDSLFFVIGQSIIVDCKDPYFKDFMHELELDRWIEWR